MKENTIQKVLTIGFIVVFVFAFNGGSAASPYVSDLSLTADSGGLTCSYTLDEDPVTGDQLAAATTWYRDGSPLLVLYLPFEGGSLNSLLDYSGNATPVTIEENWQKPTWLPTGGHDGGGAYGFDGGDFMDAGNIFPIRSSYTKTAWIYKEVLFPQYQWNNIISGHSHESNNHCFKVNPDGCLGAGHNKGDVAVSDPEPILIETWYFVAVTFDYNTGSMRLYKNGELVASDTVPAEYWDVTDPGVYIGQMETFWRWQGKLDDCRIYDYVLSSDQIQEMYEKGTNTIVPAEMNEGDQWQTEVTPFNSTEAGETVLSDILTIAYGDLDGDGVTNDIDLCPDTPAGEEVDENGCSVVNHDSDGDDIPDYMEQGPDTENPDPSYDGNGDTIADYLQNNVVSCFTYNNIDYVSLVVTDPEGATLSNVQALEPVPEMPEEMDFPFGEIAFTINGLAVGGSATVELYLPDGEGCDTYYKYGRTLDDQTEHWYEFMYDETTDTGAVIDANMITLYFVDGERGDDDLTADGVIMDDGAPANNSPVVTPEVTYDSDDDDNCFISACERSTQKSINLTLLLLFVFMLATLVRYEMNRSTK